MADVQGLPQVKFSKPEDFFTAVERDCTELVTWQSELYLELHRGTLTSQGKNKLYNRQCELLMRDLEYLSVMFGSHYPKDEIDRMYKIILMNQFHDNIPGSSIGLVYEDTNRTYADVLKSGEMIREQGFESLLKQVCTPHYKSPSSLEAFDVCRQEKILTAGQKQVDLTKLAVAVASTVHFDRAEVVEVDLPGGVHNHEVAFAQICHGKNKGLAFAKVDRFGASISSLAKPVDVKAVGARREGDTFVLDNGLVRATLDKHCRLLSLYDLVNGRESIAPGDFGNRLIIHPD